MSTPAGWFPDPQAPGQQRYFDGQAWTEHSEPQRPMPTMEQRHAILEQRVQANVLTGWRPLQVSDTSALMVTGTE